MVLIPRPLWSSDVRYRRASCCTSSSRETAVGGRGENMPTNQQQKPSTEAEPSPAGCGVVPLLTSCPALPCAHPCPSHSPSAPAHRGLVGEMWLCLWVAFPIVLFYVFLQEMSSNLPGAAPASGPEVWRGGAATSG